jgi:hypothetical protein
MRRFSDTDGQTWDVVLGRESWGTLYALFVPAGTGRDEPVRQALLHSSGYDQAQRELESMDEPQLLRLLADAEPRHP